MLQPWADDSSDDEAYFSIESRCSGYVPPPLPSNYMDIWWLRDVEDQGGDPTEVWNEHKRTEYACVTGPQARREQLFVDAFIRVLERSTERVPDTHAKETAPSSLTQASSSPIIPSTCEPRIAAAVHSRATYASALTNRHPTRTLASKKASSESVKHHQTHKYKQFQKKIPPPIDATNYPPLA